MAMSMSNSTMMPMSSMTMTFFTSHTTSLYSASWTPSTTSQYAGTCIFLLVLGAIFHGTMSFRTHYHHSLRERERIRRVIVVDGNGKKSDGIPTASKARPWRLSTDLPRALLDTLIAGIGYLLMIAAMTMNVGYFLSVLAGIFLSSLVWGRYTMRSPY